MREHPFKCLRVSQLILIYTLLKEDCQQFIQVSSIVEGMVPEKGQGIMFRFLAKIPAYRKHVFICGDEKKRPSSDQDICEYDPVILWDKLHYILIKQKIKSREWGLLGADYDQYAGQVVPYYIAFQYVDVLVELKRTYQAFLQLASYKTYCEEKCMKYELSVAEIKMIEIECLLIKDRELLRKLLRSKPADRIRLDQEENKEEGKASLVYQCALNETAETLRIKGAVVGEMVVKNKQFIREGGENETPLQLLKLNHQRENKQYKQSFDYPKFCQDIRDEMAFGTLKSTTELIDNVLVISSLDLVLRGRLLWHKGWAYKTLAQNQGGMREGLTCFSEALSCCVRAMGQTSIARAVDPVKFLRNGNVSQFFYDESFLDPRISLIADIYSASGNYFRVMNQPDKGGECSSVADRIKPWRVTRPFRQANSRYEAEPKVRLISYKE